MKDGSYYVLSGGRVGKDRMDMIDRMGAGSCRSCSSCPNLFGFGLMPSGMLSTTGFRLMHRPSDPADEGGNVGSRSGLKITSFFNDARWTRLEVENFARAKE